MFLLPRPIIEQGEGTMQRAAAIIREDETIKDLRGLVKARGDADSGVGYCPLRWCVKACREVKLHVFPTSKRKHCVTTRVRLPHLSWHICLPRASSANCQAEKNLASSQCSFHLLGTIRAGISHRHRRAADRGQSFFMPSSMRRWGVHPIVPGQTVF